MRKFSDKQQASLDAAVALLKEKGIKKIHLYDFGTYRQYEMAGSKIRQDLLESYSGDELDEDEYEKLQGLLSFTERKGFTDRLDFPDEGQNRLYLHDNGKFSHETFYI